MIMTTTSGMFKKFFDWVMRDDDERPKKPTGSLTINIPAGPSIVAIKSYSGETFRAKVKYNDWDEPYVKNDYDNYFLHKNGKAKMNGYAYLDASWKHVSGPEVHFVD